MSVPSKMIRPAVGSYSRRSARPTVDLPQPDSPDEPERLAAPDLERDAVDRLDVADVAVEHDAALDREPDLQVLDLDERRRRRSCSRGTAEPLLLPLAPPAPG